MTKEDVLELLEENKNERGMAHWEKSKHGGMECFGMGVTVLKKLSKQIGRDHELALELWSLNYYETKILSTLIDDPKKVTRDQVESQLTTADFWLISHAYCSYLMPKVACIQELAVEWTEHADDLKRRCGFLMLYQIAKNDKTLPDDFFIKYLGLIDTNIKNEENFVKDGMNSALLMIGQRSSDLNFLCIKIAKRIGKVVVDYGDNSCEAMDVVKHLTSDRLQTRLSKSGTQLSK